jgi:hypothetical protein
VSFLRCPLRVGKLDANGDLDASTPGLELLLSRPATDPRAAFVAATEEVSWTGGFAVTG